MSGAFQDSPRVVKDFKKAGAPAEGPAQEETGGGASFTGSALDRFIQGSSGAEFTPAVPEAPSPVSPEPTHPAPQAEPQFAMATSSEDSTAAQKFTGSTEASPCFTVLDMEPADVSPYSREYTDELSTTGCVAEIDMLLDYMVRQERTFGVTLPFKACGVDTIVFDEDAKQLPGGPSIGEVPVPGDTQHSASYEKIMVDGVVYLSCVSESLNPDYLHRIITEAVDAVYMHRQYVYTLIGPRPLNGVILDQEIESDEEVAESEDTGPVLVQRQQFIETMKLNSYELSVFINYMKGLQGVEVVYGTYDGRQAIMFKR